MTRVIGSEVERANGVFVSQGDKYLYVADNNNNTVGGARKAVAVYASAGRRVSIPRPVK